MRQRTLHDELKNNALAKVPDKSQMANADTQDLRPPCLSTVSLTLSPESQKEARLTRVIQILTDDNILQPNPEQLEEATKKCREYWYRLTGAAIRHHRDGVPPEWTDPRHMLWRAPAIRGPLRKFPSGTSKRKTLSAKAFSTWRLNDGGADCEVSEKERKVKAILHLGIQAPPTCTFTGDSFRQWIGTTGEAKDAPNYLGILALGWSYILSARLVEIQGKGAVISYTNSKAIQCDEAESGSVPDVIVDIGNANADVARWWSAILARGGGWKAIIEKNKDGEFLAPWSISIDEKHSFGVKWQGNDPLPDAAPLSSDRAFEVLAEFSLLHNLGSQFLVAFAAALTFPTHKHHKTEVRLPLPTQTGQKSSTATSGSVPSQWAMVKEHLPNYISLSCCPELIMSTLCGMFWEPDVPCNLVSPWLHPILSEVRDAETIAAKPGSYHEILGIICGFRRPQICSLWLGAVISGLTPKILRLVERGKPPLNLLAFPWTGCPQTFMDTPGSGPYVHGDASGDKVERADVWRLLHVLPLEEDDYGYHNRPTTPWAPFGKTKKEYCSLNVYCHLGCQRHHLEYQHWNWKLDDGSVIEDPGLANTSSANAPVPPLPEESLPEIPQKPVDQKASQDASQDIFGWFVNGGEGSPPEALYKDAWIKIRKGDEDNDEMDLDEREIATDSAPKKKKKQRVNQLELDEWLDTLSDG